MYVTGQLWATIFLFMMCLVYAKSIIYISMFGFYIMCWYYGETLECVIRHKCVLSPLFSSLCQAWDCSSFLNLSSKCATSPVSCCWDSVVGCWAGNGWSGGIKTAEKMGEQWGGECYVQHVYVGHHSLHPSIFCTPIFSSALLPSSHPCSQAVGFIWED